MKKITFIIFLVFAHCFSQTSASQLSCDKKTFTYKIAGQDSIKSDFYQISNDQIIRPLIVWIHGGALIWGSRASLPEEQLEFYLNAGYSVLSIDYRLAPETKLAEIVTDVKDAIVWAQNHNTELKIDQNRLFVIGHSAGAYLALMTGYMLEHPPRAIVSFYGYGDIQSSWSNQPDSSYLKWDSVSKEKALNQIHSVPITNASSKERFSLYLYSRQQGSWAQMISGRNPLQEPTYFDPFCPVKNINSHFPPVLLIHGDKDTDVPFEQSVLLDQALSAKNIDHRFIKMTGFDHAFDKSEGGLGNAQISDAFQAVVRFMDKQK